jgi:hypothetical protein
MDMREGVNGMPLHTNPDGTITLRDYSKSQTVIFLTNRIKILSIDLNDYLIDITDYWNCNTRGFKCLCINDKMTIAFLDRFNRAFPKIAKDALPSEMLQSNGDFLF